jgi:hypothetical protein
VTRSVDADKSKADGVGFSLDASSPGMSELQDHLSASMETALDCIRLVLAAGAALQAAASDDGKVIALDDDTGPAIGEVAPHRPLDQLREDSAAPGALLFQQTTTIAALAMSWAATQTDRTVAEVLSEVAAIALPLPPRRSGG